MPGFTSRKGRGTGSARWLATAARRIPLHYLLADDAVALDLVWVVADDEPVPRRAVRHPPGGPVEAGP